MSVDNKISLDPRLVVSENPIQFSELGPVNVIPQRVASNSCTNSNIQFSPQLSPGENTYLSKCMVLEVDVAITVNGATAVLNGAGGNYGLTLATCNPINTVFRSYPLTRNMSALELTLNSVKLSVNPAQEWVNLGWFVHTDKQRRELASMYPTQLDTCAKLSVEGGNTTNASPYYTQVNQVLSNYINSNGANRGSFYPVSVVGNVYTFKLYEVLIISPLDQGLYNSSYLANVRDFQLNINFQDSTQINLLTSSIALTVGAGNNVQIALGSPAYLHYSYLVPSAEIPMVPTAIYTYDNIFHQPTTVSAPTYSANFVGSANSNAIKLSVMPKLVYVSVAKNTATTRATNDLDICAEITSLTVQWGQKGTQFFTNYDQYDLWRLTMRNTGSDMTFNEWKNACNVIVFRPSVDIGNDIASLEGSTNSSLMFNITNCSWNIKNYVRAAVDPTASNNNWNLNLTVVSQGQCVIEQGRLSTNIAVISPSEALVALDEGGLTAENVIKPTEENGAGLFSTARNIFHHGHQLVKKGAQLAQSPAGQSALKYLSGSGATGGGYISQGKMKYRK